MTENWKKKCEAAEAEVARLRETLSFTAGQRDGCKAEVARLREVLNALAGEEPPMDSREALMTH